MNKLRKPLSDFTIVPNALIRSENLSLKAKGLYCLLFSKPDGWTYIEDVLVRESADGRDAFRAGVKELTDAGWLSKVQVQDEQGRFSHTDWCLSVDVLAVAGKPVAGQSATTNTDISKTDKIIPSVSPTPAKTKVAKDANPRTSLVQFLTDTDGLPPASWAAYPRNEFGWPAERLNTVWRGFQRYWTSPDCPKPLKRDWKGTWENWCDREAKDGRRGGGAGGGTGGNLAAALGSYVARGTGNGAADGPASVSSGADTDKGVATSRYGGPEIPF